MSVCGARLVGSFPRIVSECLRNTFPVRIIHCIGVLLEAIVSQVSKGLRYDLKACFQRNTDKMGLGLGGLFRKIIGITVNSNHKQGRIEADSLLRTAGDPGAFIGRDVETILQGHKLLGQFLLALLRQAASVV